MTLPSKYSGPSTRRGTLTGYLIIGLILAGIVGGLILLAAVSPKYIPIDSTSGLQIEYKTEGVWRLLLFLFSIVGVLLLLARILERRRYRRL